MPRSAGSRRRVRPERRSGWSRAPTAGAAPSFTTSPVYRPRRPAETPLYRVVQHHLNTFLAQAEADEIRPLPRWTEREFRQYLTCGILAYGFARARCGDCHQERLVAFSCKGRGVCPSCTNRRMAEVAAHLRDRVIPWVPVRQWVLSVPKRLRPALARDADLAGAMLRILLRVIRRALRDTAGIPLPAESRLGAVSFLHRFGSALNPHPHFHLAVTDGLFARGHDDALTFHPARRLDAANARSLTPVVQHRILRLYVRRGLLTRAEADDMLRWRGTGGFSLDGSVRVAAHDRSGLERLLRYCARPPFALHRLRHATPDRPLSSLDARLVYHLPRPARDGRITLRLAPLELLDRLARLIPPPRLHRHRYHGVFAPNAAWRKQVVPYGREEAEDTDASDLVVAGTDPCRHTPDRSPSAARARSRWAQLLARVYEIDPLRCPACHGEMRIVSFLTDPPVVRQILEHLDLPIRPPILAPARGPPQHELLSVDPPSPFDLPASAPAERDPFDQSLPGDDGTWSA